MAPPVLDPGGRARAPFGTRLTLPRRAAGKVSFPGATASIRNSLLLV